ncbi:transcription initiation factor IIB-like [Octopus vulgaris]|uniref:Transcription initiation factor IIB-like n=2 Tax=Octopus TaxID=6643 RepID=A0AA36BQH1_OCTVU|nr:transcription initiation factor IIB-like [Octopus sinensis]CAI9738474.1 transcription initiation factor IIB-like [Octopus vulgaris]
MALRASRMARLHCSAHPDSPLIEDYHAGDMICSECGLVVGDRVIDVGSEWRTFNNDKNTKDASRVGAAENPLLDGGDLSTMIATSSGDTLLDDNGKPMYHSRRNLSVSDRTLLTAFREISQMSERLNLPTMIADQANTLFKQVHESKSLKGRANDAIASACMYIACRQEGVPRTFKEICAVSKVSKKEIGRTFKLILKTLETNVDLITTGDFMSRFCSSLSMTNHVQKAATHIAKTAVDLDLVPGKSPVTVAAAAIYMASQASENKKTQREISVVTGVAEVTIRQSYKLMYPRARDLFPSEFKFATPIDLLPTQ